MTSFAFVFYHSTHYKDTVGYAIVACIQVEQERIPNSLPFLAECVTRGILLIFKRHMSYTKKLEGIRRFNGREFYHKTRIWVFPNLKGCCEFCFVKA